MATNNYTISFKSLRAGTDYLLTIGGGSGTAIPLKGAAKPFETRENADEDVFKPVRTQTGYLRIVDDGKDANGNTLGANWWQDLIPASDTERPVLLTTNNTIVWQGYMQTQNFDGPIDRGTTEREFPVQCMLAALGSVNVDVLITLNNTQKHVVNFYALIYYAFSKVSAMTISDFRIQGGHDADEWLSSKFDWQNLLTKGENGLEARYSYLKALEDMCRFWGWTLRTCGTSIYMTQYGASDVVREERITMANVLLLAENQSASFQDLESYYSAAVIGEYANTEQQETVVRGYTKAIVKADCNETTIGVDYSAQDVSDALGDEWTWNGGEGEQVGFFFTTPQSSFIADEVSGTGSNGGQFYREQIYSTEEDTTATEVNVIGIPSEGNGTKVFATLQSKRIHRFGPGSLVMTGDLWRGVSKVGLGKIRDYIYMRIGIGTAINNATWFNIDQWVDRNTKPALNAGWGTTANTILVFPNSGKLSVGTRFWNYNPLGGDGAPDSSYAFPAIPIDSFMEGYVFVQFLGSQYEGLNDWGFEAPFEISNFKMEYSRDAAWIPPTLNSAPQGRTVTEKRQSSYEYRSNVWGKDGGEWSADCIFASDHKMKYGLGLLMTNLGAWLTTVEYNGVQKVPEVHLSEAVTAFWSQKRNLYHTETQVTNNTNVTPATLTKNGYTLAIGRDWRDDIIKVDSIV